MPEENFDDVINDANIPESNWFKFNVVGDKITGELVEVRDRPANGVFPPSRAYSLKQASGEVMHVSFPLNKDYVISRMNTAKLGDIVGFMFKAEVPSATKGFAAAKSIEVYVKHVEPKEDFGLGEMPAAV